MEKNEIRETISLDKVKAGRPLERSTTMEEILKLEEEIRIATLNLRNQSQIIMDSIKGDEGTPVGAQHVKQAKMISDIADSLDGLAKLIELRIQLNESR